VETCPSDSFLLTKAGIAAHQINLGELKAKMICRPDVDMNRVSTTDVAVDLAQKNSCATFYVDSKPRT